MRSVVEQAAPSVADDIAGVLARRLLPAAAEGRLDEFGSAVTEIGRLNGAWYADEQGGVFRPPVGTVVAELENCSAITGIGQSSWGPTVYGVTDTGRVVQARAAAEAALDVAEVGGEVLVSRPAQDGVRIEAEAELF
jgi:beta-ribofuranosylaminobenzene 5'-phosphate synthase